VVVKKKLPNPCGTSKYRIPVRSMEHEHLKSGSTSHCERAEYKSS